MKHSSRRTCQLSDMDVSDIDEIVKVRKWLAVFQRVDPRSQALKLRTHYSTG
jgi:hypothetical protein